MSRPIRYRVWDGERMHEPAAARSAGFCLTAIGEVWQDTSDEFSDGEGEVYRRNAVALLSTGLTDGEGREVFEGDVMRWTFGPHEQVEPVRWVDGLFWPIHLWDADGNIDLPVERGVVIGHIFEPRFAHLRETETA